MRWKGRNQWKKFPYQLSGNSKGHDLDILIDSGSTVSFIQTTTAAKLGCKLHATKSAWIRVAGAEATM